MDQLRHGSCVKAETLGGDCGDKAGAGGEIGIAEFAIAADWILLAG